MQVKNSFSVLPLKRQAVKHLKKYTLGLLAEYLNKSITNNTPLHATL